MKKKIILSISAIIIVLGIVFLSQQANLGGVGKDLISSVTNQAKAYASDGFDSALSKIYPTISEEVQKRGDIIKNEVAQEKQKISENIGQKISNYFSGVTDSILHPGTSQNCPAVPPDSATPAN
jgi:predicted PurR-regulated permease PerM